MKRIGNVFDKIADIDNIRLAFDKAVRHKKNRKNIRKHLKNKEELCQKIHQMLIEGTFKTSAYHTREIYEPKKRTIYILPFYPDRIIHHAVVNVMEPLWTQRFIDDSYSCIKGRGQHKASIRCAEFTAKYRYALKMDISKFYPSINHAKLKQILASQIKDTRLLELLYNIIDSVPGDTNVPIGNLLSQWLGNIYMNEYDKFVVHVLKPCGYLRYCDDCLVFANDKETLHKILELSEKFFNDQLQLRLSEKEIFTTSRGVYFVGYRHFKHRYILARKRTVNKAKRTTIEISRTLTRPNSYSYYNVLNMLSKIGSIEGWLKHCNSHNLRKRLKTKQLHNEIYIMLCDVREILCIMYKCNDKQLLILLQYSECRNKKVMNYSRRCKQQN